MIDLSMGHGRRLLRLFLAGLLFAAAASACAVEPKVAASVAQSGEAFLVDATLEVPVAPEIAWAVLTDFEHMTAILGNLKSSAVIRRDGNTWVVRQTGAVKYGFLSFAFESEREIRLEPMKRMLARSLAGAVKRMESETLVAALEPGTQIKYHAEIVPDSFLARLFGGSFVRHEIEEQFMALGQEMMRRQGRAEVTPHSGSESAH